MPKGFSEREKEAIRKRLIKAGYKQFSAYGLKKTNVEELAAGAQISKGAFYLFYESKEALLMDVVEWAEQRYRQDILAAVDLPGPSPRARLAAILRKSFALIKTMPVLQVFTGSDFELLFRKVPAEKIQEHLASDRLFLEELVARCRQVGIPVTAAPEVIGSLLYPLVLASLREAGDQGENSLGGSVDLLLELVAAFALGEIDVPQLGEGKAP
ncbi:MAG: TetR/AcrR family transcriptional regulator [Anaerolineales bacterium]